MRSGHFIAGRPYLGPRTGSAWFSYGSAVTQTRTGLAAGLVALVAAVVLVLGAPGAASGKIVADSGFRPARDGFSFENYGTSNNANLSPQQVRMLYGSGVCAFVTKSGQCVLTPPGLVWLQQANQSMNGGHCEGFSVLSLLLFRGLYPPFGPGPTSGLKLKGDVALQRTIAYAFMYQNLPAVIDQSVKGTPNHVLRFLISALGRRGGESYGLGIYKRDRSGGHEITPYAVDDRGGGRFDVLLYDNNWPGVTRRLHVNTRADTWSYQASTNPRAPGSLYEGDAKTKTLELDPLTPGLGVHPCPFCAAARPAKGAYNELRLEGNPRNHAHLLIVDSRGRRLGYVGNRLVNEIPGARAISPLANQDWREAQEPVYRVPAGLGVSVTVDGSRLRSADTESLSLIGPGHDAAVQDIRLRPGEHNTFLVSASAGKLAYRSARGQRESPRLDLGLAGSRGDFRFRVMAVALNPSSTASAALDRRRSTLTFRDLGTRPQAFKVELTRYTRSGLQQLQAKLVPLRPGFEAVVRYGKLRPGQRTVPIVIRRVG
jgi:hypothetical protein